MKRIWEIVHDSDDENGNPTCWSCEINHERYGKYAWISLYDGGIYVVETIPEQNVIWLANCKSLMSAKRWVSMNL